MIDYICFDLQEVSERDLVVHLRELFSAMDCSDYKYIDPSPVIQILNTLQRRVNGGQSIIGSQQVNFFFPFLLPFIDTVFTL